MKRFCTLMALAILVMSSPVRAEVNMGTDIPEDGLVPVIQESLRNSMVIDEENPFSARAVTPGARYSNVTNFLASGFSHGGSTVAAFRTNMRADDLNMISGTNANQVTVSLANFNTGTTHRAVRLRVRFWDTTGTAGAPGTYLGGFDSTANLACPSSSVCTFTFTLGSAITLPQNIWAGVSHDTLGTGISNSFGGTAALPTTTTQLNAMGQGLYNPPDVGTSADRLFAAGTSSSGWAVNNPTGSIVNAPFTTAIANAGWEIVPEPASLTLVGLALLALRRRR